MTPEEETFYRTMYKREIVRKAVKCHYDKNKEKILLQKKRMYEAKVEFKRLGKMYDIYL